MRSKMKSIREKRESKLRKDAWAKWRQSYRSHLSGQHYAERLVLRLFQRWRTRQIAIEHLKVVGDQFLDVYEHKAADRYWIYWRRAVELKISESTITERVSLRIMGDALDIWKRRS